MKEPPHRKWRSRHTATRCCAQRLLAACVMQNVVPFTIDYGDTFIHHRAACSLCAVLLAISFISSVGDHCFEQLRVTYLLSKLHLIVGQMLFLVPNFDAKYYFRVRHWNWYPRLGSLRTSWIVPVSCSLQILISSMHWRFLTKTWAFRKAGGTAGLCSLSNVVRFVTGYRCWSAGKLVETLMALSLTASADCFHLRSRCKGQLKFQTPKTRWVVKCFFTCLSRVFLHPLHVVTS